MFVICVKSSRCINLYASFKYILKINKMTQEYSMGVKEFAEWLFDKPANPKAGIFNIGATMTSNNLPPDISLNDILMAITFYGAQILYGENVKATDITHDQFDKLNEYIKSLGFIMERRNAKRDGQDFIDIWFTPYVEPTAPSLDHLE